MMDIIGAIVATAVDAIPIGVLVGHSPASPGSKLVAFAAAAAWGALVVAVAAFGGFAPGATGPVPGPAFAFGALAPASPRRSSTGASGGAQTDQAPAAYDAGVAAYRQTVLTAFQEVEDNLAALRILADEARVQDEAVNAARQTVTVTTDEPVPGGHGQLPRRGRGPDDGPRQRADRRRRPQPSDGGGRAPGEGAGRGWTASDVNDAR